MNNKSKNLSKKDFKDKTEQNQLQNTKDTFQDTPIDFTKEVIQDTPNDLTMEFIQDTPNDLTKEVDQDDNDLVIFFKNQQNNILVDGATTNKDILSNMQDMQLLSINQLDNTSMVSNNNELIEKTKLLEQLDFFKNLAEENKVSIHLLNITLEENKRLVLQLLEENDQLKNKINKMNNIDMLIKLKENFNNKQIELVSDVNIDEFKQESIMTSNLQVHQEISNNIVIEKLVKPKKRGNPFGRRIL